MSYQQFLNNTILVINKFTNLLSYVLNYLMSNFIFKTIIYFILLFFVIYIAEKIFLLIQNILKPHKNKFKDKEV